MTEQISVLVGLAGHICRLGRTFALAEFNAVIVLVGIIRISSVSLLGRLGRGLVT